MSDKPDYRNVMERSKLHLIRELNPEPVLDMFIQYEFLPPEQVGNIEKLESTSEKNRELIEMVITKGENWFLKFKESLLKTQQGFLADYLVMKEGQLLEEQQSRKTSEFAAAVYNSVGWSNLTSNSLQLSESQSISRTDQKDYHRDEPSNKTDPQQNAVKRNTDIRKDDGRIQDVDVDWVESEIQSDNLLAHGGTAKVYLCNDKVKWGRQVVVKKIERIQNSNNIINEIVAGRLRHHYIVPLLAKCNNDTHSFFIFPYMEKGELRKYITEDNIKGAKVQMNLTKRVSILYKIACAILYIHTPVDGLRNIYIHGDITSRNIALDGNYNPRLLDFGISREMMPGKDKVTVVSGDMAGTPGYFTDSSSTKLSTETDCRNFGVLIKEMLTGSEPIDEDGRQLQTQVIYHGKPRFTLCYEKVWRDEERIYNELKTLAEKCLSKKVNASNIAQKLHAILRDLNHESKDEALGDKNCSLCMLNKIVADDTNLYLQNCFDNLPHDAPPVCVACMRNSFLNPIQCRRCRKTIPTKIGFSWAAILIKGYDTEEKYREAINKDVKEIQAILTSKHPLVTGLREENVIVTTLHGLSKAIHKLEKCTTLYTLIVYYSGHNNEEIGFQVDFSKDDFISCLNVTKKNIILIMDCCFCPNLKSSVKNIKLQMNASRPAEEAEFTSEGSIFTQVFVETLRRNSTDSSYKDNPDFIPVVSLFEQIKKEMKVRRNGRGSTPTIDLTVTGEVDMWIGYTHNTTGIKLFYDAKDDHFFEADKLSTMKELKADLLRDVLRDKYKGQLLAKHGDTLTKYSDIIAISIRKRTHERHELTSIEEVTTAWNQKFELTFGVRNIQNIHNGMVGVFLPETQTNDTLLRYSRSIGGEMNENLNETIVKLQWTQKAETMDKLYELKTTKGVEQDAAYKWLYGTLAAIDDNPVIEEATNVVFTVQSNTWKKNSNDFLTIELEGSKLN